MADLTQTVARALWKLRQCHKAMKSSEHVQDESKEEAEVRKHSQRVTMLDDLNVRASRHANNYLHEHKKSTFEFVHVNIQDEVKKFDPQLWEAVCILTTSAWEKQHPLRPSELALHTKMIRRFFILCAIMHCINEDFTIPLHTLITDIVDGQGGSALLIRILNRLGVCSSLKSLNRYMQDKRANRENYLSCPQSRQLYCYLIGQR